MHARALLAGSLVLLALGCAPAAPPSAAPSIPTSTSAAGEYERFARSFLDW